MNIILKLLKTWILYIPNKIKIHKQRKLFYEQLKKKKNEITKNEITYKKSIKKDDIPITSAYDPIVANFDLNKIKKTSDLCLLLYFMRLQVSLTEKGLLTADKKKLKLAVKRGLIKND